MAATAVFLDILLLTCDSDFGRGVELASDPDPASPWSRFGLHPASVVR